MGSFLWGPSIPGSLWPFPITFGGVPAGVPLTPLLHHIPFLFGGGVQAAELRVEQSPHPKPKPPPEHLKFGQTFTDHMLTIEWSRADGWGPPRIRPFQDLRLHPASSALHYAVEVSPKNSLK